MLQDKLNKFQELINSEWDKSVLVELKQISEEIKDCINRQEEEHLKAFIQDPENDPNDYAPESIPEKDNFKELSEIYREKRKIYAEERAKEERANLGRKEAIIKNLEALTEEENIGKAFSSFKELSEEFKTIGRVPGDKHKDIQTAYHNACDKFFYNIRIYQDLKDLDLKANLVTKQEIIEKIKGLVNLPPKEAESNVKLFIAEWYETGPVPKEEYEALKETFKQACDSIYEKIKTFHALRKQAMGENLEKKQAILAQVNDLVNKERNSLKDWNKATSKILAFQEEWKSIGFGPKKENEEVWQNFRSLCDNFFAEKKVFFEGLHQEQDINKLKKLELIEKAEELSGSTEWGAVTKKLVHLQNDWKKIGPARQKDEKKLWTRFRAACNSFFDAKKAHFNEQDQSQKGNLEAKNAVIARINSLEVKGDKAENIKNLKALISEFNAAGHVPKSDIKALNKNYEEALNAFFEKAKLDKNEVEQSRFVAKIEGILKDDNFEERLQKEVKILREKINTQELELRNYERNLSFFSGSKGNPLLKEAELKVKKTQDIIDSIKAQIKLINKMKKEVIKAQESHANQEEVKPVADEA